MATIGLVIRPGLPAALELGHELIAWAETHGHKIIVNEQTGKLIGHSGPIRRRPEIAAEADPIVTLGGDGTLIGVARHVEGRSPVMIGVNFGRLGFLTEIYPSELLTTLEQVLGGKAAFGVRSMLLVEVRRDNQKIFTSQALNEATIIKGATDPILPLDLSVNGEAVMRTEGDGLIIATPTGSTAYSLSAGGSIVEPWLSVVLITPICPHSLTGRPLILELDSKLQVDLPPYRGRVFLNVDGQVSSPLQPKDTITITRAPNTVRFVRSPARTYFQILRSKLNWGLGNRNE